MSVVKFMRSHIGNRLINNIDHEFYRFQVNIISNHLASSSWSSYLQLLMSHWFQRSWNHWMKWTMLCRLPKYLHRKLLCRWILQLIFFIGQRERSSATNLSILPPPPPFFSSYLLISLYLLNSQTCIVAVSFDFSCATSMILYIDSNFSCEIFKIFHNGSERCYHHLGYMFYKRAFKNWPYFFSTLWVVWGVLNRWKMLLITVQ